MRNALSLLMVVLFSGVASAQAKINSVRVGFQPYADDAKGFKVGLWTPIHVEVQAGADGLRPSLLAVETPDSEDVGAVMTVSVPQLGPNERRLITNYAKPGKVSASFKLRLHNREDGELAQQGLSATPLKLGGRLYVTLGSKLPDLRDALKTLAPRPAGGDDATPTTWPRFAAFEDDAAALSDHAFGYETADLVILTTENADFLTALARDDKRDRKST